MKDPRSGFGLVSFVVALIIIGVFVGYVYFGQYSKPGPGGQKTNVMNQSVDTGKATACRADLQQIRSAVQVFMVDSDTPPSELGQLQLQQPLLVCPVSQQAYLYDSSTGNVQCPTHPTF
jgi:hypothetical protein